MTRILLILIFTTFHAPFNCIAQHENITDNKTDAYKVNIQFGATNFNTIHDSYKPSITQFSLKQINISTAYSLNNKIKLQAQFSAWTNWGASPMGVSPVIVFEDWGLNAKPGDIAYRIAYKMFDCYAMYYPQLWDNPGNEIFAGLGISYTWGKDNVVESVYQHPGYYDIIINSKTVAASYWGIVPTIGYNYKLLNNHINIGTSLKTRLYKERIPQLDFSMHIGYNFIRHKN